MAGVVLNPGTPLSQIEYVLTEVPTRINPGGFDGFGWVLKDTDACTPNRVRLVERWDIRIASQEGRMSKSWIFFFVDISFLIASMSVFFLNIALHENNSKKINTFHVGQTGKNNVFFFF